MAGLADQLAERLGLPPGTDEQMVLNTLDYRLTKAAEAEVDAAVADGRILAAHKGYWLQNFKQNYGNTRSVLGSLGPQSAPVVAPPLNSASAPPTALPPNVSEQTMTDAQADKALWDMGFRDMKGPRSPNWWDICPPKEV